VVSVTSAQWALYGMPNCSCIGPICNWRVAKGGRSSSGNFACPFAESLRQFSVISAEMLLPVVLRRKIVGCRAVLAGSPRAGSGIRSASIGARIVYCLAAVTGRAAEAEAEFRTSIRIEPRDESWLDLGLFYLTQKRYADAVEVFKRSAESSSRPHDLWMLLGQAYLQQNQPEQALVALDKAEASSPFRDEGESLGANFNSMIATGRAKAWYQLGDVARAVSFQEDAVKLAPNDAKLWLGLADLYDAQGRTAEAEQARGRAAGR